MGKIKILFMDHTPFIGGAQLCLASHIKHLNRKRLQPMLVVGRDSTVLGLYDKCKVPIFRIHFEQLKSLTPKSLTRLSESLKQFKQLVNKLNPGIVLANTTRALVLAALGKKDYQLICYVRDYDYPKWLIRLVKGRVDKFLFVSKSIQQFYNLEGEVVYLGVDMKIQNSHCAKQTKFSPREASKIQNFRKKSGLKKGDIAVGFVGRLVEWKGAGVLVDAIAKINNPKVKLLIFGTGPAAENLKLKTKNLKLEDKVRFVGFESNRGLIYQVIDIFVLPSQNPEPFATTMIEASSFGLPIIATQNGGTGEFIKNNRNGLLVKAGSVSLISQAITKLVQDKKLAYRLGKQALLDVRHFSERAFAVKLERVYESCINS